MPPRTSTSMENPLLRICHWVSPTKFRLIFDVGDPCSRVMSPGMPGKIRIPINHLLHIHDYIYLWTLNQTNIFCVFRRSIHNPLLHQHFYHVAHHNFAGKLGVYWLYNNWLVVSTHLKNIGQTGNFPQIGMKISKKKWNHHLDNFLSQLTSSWHGLCIKSLYILENSRGTKKTPNWKGKSWKIIWTKKPPWRLGSSRSFFQVVSIFTFTLRPQFPELRSMMFPGSLNGW